MSFSLDTEAKRREAILWSYRLFLDRDPETNAAVANFPAVSETTEIRRLFLGSDEYRGKQVVSDLSPNTVPLNRPANRVDVQMDAKSAELLRRHVEQTWVQLGQSAPHWSVLSSDAFRPENIVKTEADFYASGDADAELLISILARHGLQPRDLPRCFEFGCGVGRVTLSLAKRFETVVGCDISASHLATASQHISSVGGASNVTLIHANTDHFGMTEPFDLWFSRLVLQHNPPPLMRNVLDRAFSFLRPCGVAIFQVPTWAEGYSFNLDTYLRNIDSRGGIEMHCLPQTEIFALAASHNLKTLEVREEYSAGPSKYWISNLFVLQRDKLASSNSLRSTVATNS